MTDLSDYFAGRRLWGDDFDDAAIAQWIDDERTAYEALGSGFPVQYPYHALNAAHGYEHLGNRSFRHALGLGSATGAEFLPIAERLKRITSIEPSAALRKASTTSLPIEYVEPTPTGQLPFDDGSFDLAVSFGTLHHLPNVSLTVRELARCLEPDGLLLVREPTISMGDWRNQRPGLTSRERGIPLQLFRRMVEESGFDVAVETRCMFSLTGRLIRVARVAPYRSRVVVRVDQAVCALFGWNRTYHATTLLQRLRPTNVFYVLRRRRQ